MTKNGPYLVEGAVPMARQTIVADADGDSRDWQEGESFEDQGELRTLPLRSDGNQALLRRLPCPRQL